MLALVTGAGGFIGGHLVKRLIRDGFAVHGVDVKPLKEWWQVNPRAFSFDGVDLRSGFPKVMDRFDYEHVYHLAGDVGGMGYTTRHPLMGLGNSQISANVLELALDRNSRLFFASSACVYPEIDGDCLESLAYPAQCSADGYGWEKFFTEMNCLFASKERGLTVRIARFHNSYGPYGTFEGGKEKAPAAMLRKVLAVKRGQADCVEVWGDGKQTRSFTYVSDVVEGITRIMGSDYKFPINLGSTERVSINRLAEIAQDVLSVKVPIRHIESDTLGVKGRNSQNDRIKSVCGWEPTIKLCDGMRVTAEWMEREH